MVITKFCAVACDRQLNIHGFHHLLFRVKSYYDPTNIYDLCDEEGEIYHIELRKKENNVCKRICQNKLRSSTRKNLNPPFHLCVSSVYYYSLKCITFEISIRPRFSHVTILCILMTCTTSQLSNDPNSCCV